MSKDDDYKIPNRGSLLRSCKGAIVLDEDSADWRFVCPPDYKGIENKTRRIREFYKDGFTIIPQAASALGYMVGTNIPRRYRRRFNMMGE